MTKCRAQFKYALRQCRREEARYKTDVLAKSMDSGDNDQFWSDMRKYSVKSTVLSDSMGGITTEQDIAGMWKTHFDQILNSVNNDKHKDSVLFSLDECIYSHDINVTVDEIRHCISVTKCGKAGGPDGLSAECFKFASDTILIHLSSCFTAMLMHGHTYVTLVEVCLVPIVKNKNCDITSPYNYRPIALVTVASKILELLILQRCEDKLYTADAQFGFQSDHSTETCTVRLWCKG
jgi:hypothetical protein